MIYPKPRPLLSLYIDFVFGGGGGGWGGGLGRGVFGGYQLVFCISFSVIEKKRPARLHNVIFSKD